MLGAGEKEIKLGELGAGEKEIKFGDEGFAVPG